MLKLILTVTLLLALTIASSAQNVLRIHSLTGEQPVEIKSRDFIKCRYRLFRQQEFLAGGIVQSVTDSTLIYRSNRFSGNKQISLASTSAIDRVPLKRTILPSVVIGVMAGAADVLFNRRNSMATSSLLIAGGTLLSVNYVYRFNNRKLNKSRIGETVDLSVDKLE